jgi:glycosyltransferase involved in cell wall biosynthesis
MSDKSPLVSVVIPCYNYGKYVEEAIDSCLQSTLTDLEIIVVNDGSTDPDTIEFLAQLDKPKTLVIHQENKGLPAARNVGIRQSRGKYILPLDADDKIDPSLLEKEVDILESDPHLGFVTSWMKSFGDSQVVWRFPAYNFYKLLFCNMVANSSLFRKEAWEQVDGYNEQMKRGYEDWDFWISLGEKGWRGNTIPEALLFWRKHSRSMISESVRIHDHLVEQIIQNHPSLYTPEKKLELRQIWLPTEKPNAGRLTGKPSSAVKTAPSSLPAMHAASAKPQSKKEKKNRTSPAPEKKQSVVQRKPSSTPRSKLPRSMEGKTHTQTKKSFSKPLLFI